MDGVPVKIGERYKPRKKLNLPGSVVNKISALQEVQPVKYDFRFEKSVLEQVKKINDFKLAAKEKKKKKIEASVIVEEKPETSEESSPDTPTSPDLQTNPETVSPIPYDQFTKNNQTESCILTPMPVPRGSQIKKKSIDNSILSEFESDTSSPFDNMELKSINDMQELADVLGSKPEEAKPQTPNGVTTTSWNNNVYGTNHLYYTSGYANHGLLSRTLYGSYSSGMPTLSGGGIACSPQHSYNRGQMSYSGTLSPPFSPQPPPIPPKPVSMTSQQLYTGTYPAPYPTQPSYPTSTAPTSSYPYPAPAQPPSDSPSPSFSLLKDLQTITQERQSQQVQVSQVGKARSEDETSGKLSLSSLPNPMEQLGADGRALAHKMHEMGFPVSRAARAVQHLGPDEAKVIELLLGVQRLEESAGVGGDLAETALISHQLDEQASHSYLDNVKRLLDFGFPEDRVTSALKETNNDADQALEHLLS